MRHHRFCHRDTNIGEHRPCFFSGEGPNEQRPTSPSPTPEISREREQKTLTDEEKAKEREQREASLKTIISSTLDANSKAFEDIPDEQKRREVQNQIRDRLHTHFMKNMATTLESRSFEEFQEHCRKEVEQALYALGRVTEEVKKKIEATITKEQKEQADIQKKKIEDLKNMDVNTLKNALTAFNLTKAELLSNAETFKLDEAALQNPENIQMLQAQFKKHGDDATKLQEAQENLSDLSTHISIFHEKAVDEMKCMNDTANAAIAGTVGIAAGAAVGFAIGAAAGSVVPVIGNIIGGILGGAIAAVAAYATVRAAAATVDSLVRDTHSKANEFNTVLTTSKGKFNKGNADFAAVIGFYENEGGKLNDAPEAFRRRAAEFFTERRAEIARREGETEQAYQDRVQKVRDLFAARLGLVAERQRVEEHRQEFEEQSAQLSEQEQTIENRGEEVRDGVGRVEEAITQVQQAITVEDNPQRREALQKRLDDLKPMVQRGSSAVDQLTIGGTQIEEGLTNIEEAEAQLASAAFSIDDHERMLEDTEALLTVSIEDIRKHLEELGVAGEGVKQDVVLSQDAFVQLDTAIADQVLRSGLTNLKAVDDMNAQAESINKLQDIRPEGFSSLGGTLDSFHYAFAGFATGTRAAFGGVCWLIDKANDILIKSWAKDIPVLNLLGEIPSLATGIVEGAGEILAGMGHMIAHLDQTWDGVKALVGQSDTVTAGQAWGAMRDAIFATKEFGEGQYGKGIGKAFVNISLFFVGGAGAGASTYNALRALGYGRFVAVGAGLGVAVGTSVKHMYTGLKSAPGALAQMAVKAPVALLRAPGAIVRGVAHAPGTIMRGVARGINRLRMSKADQLALRAERAAQAAEAAAASLEQMINAGQVPAKLLGKTPEEVVAILNNPALHAEYGLNTVGTMSQALRYQQMLIQSQSASKLQQLAYIEATEQAASKAGTTEAAATKAAPAPGNAAVPTQPNLPPGTPPPGSTGKGLDIQRALFDDAGNLRITDPAEISKLIGNDPLARIEVAQTLIGRPLTAAERSMVLKIHSRGPAIGEVNAGNIFQKGPRDLLKSFREYYELKGMPGPQARLRARQDLQRLMDRGVLGESAAEGTVAGQGGRIEGAVNDGLRNFVTGRNKTLRYRDVIDEINVTDDLMKTYQGTPSEMAQLQRQYAQLQHLRDSINGAVGARTQLKGMRVVTNNKLENFLSGKSNTINRTCISSEIDVIDGFLKNPALEDATRASLTEELRGLTKLYNHVDDMQVARGLPSKPLVGPSATPSAVASEGTVAPSAANAAPGAPTVAPGTAAKVAPTSVAPAGPGALQRCAGRCGDRWHAVTTREGLGNYGTWMADSFRGRSGLTAWPRAVFSVSPGHPGIIAGHVYGAFSLGRDLAGGVLYLGKSGLEWGVNWVGGKVSPLADRFRIWRAGGQEAAYGRVHGTWQRLRGQEGAEAMARMSRREAARIRLSRMRGRESLEAATARQDVRQAARNAPSTTPVSTVRPAQAPRYRIVTREELAAMPQNSRVLVRHRNGNIEYGELQGPAEGGVRIKFEDGRSTIMRPKSAPRVAPGEVPTRGPAQSQQLAVDAEGHLIVGRSPVRPTPQLNEVGQVMADIAADARATNIAAARAPRGPGMMGRFLGGVQNRWNRLWERTRPAEITVSNFRLEIGGVRNPPLLTLEEIAQRLPQAGINETRRIMQSMEQYVRETANRPQPPGLMKRLGELRDQAIARRVNLGDLGTSRGGAAAAA